MALDKKLKSDMTNTAGETPDSGKSVVLSEKNSASLCAEHAETAAPKQDADFVSEDSSTDGKPVVSDNETTALLKSIENQLRALNQSIADLEQEVGNNYALDDKAILLKIDSARCSIEKAVAGIETSSSAASNKPILDEIAELKSIINTVAEKQERNDRQLAQTLRQNANFQIQVRQGMQRDIDAFKEQQTGEQFNPILKEIASIYVEYQGLLEDESISDLSRKNLKALFGQLEDMLLDHEAEISRSEIGDVRQTRRTKIIGKIPTGDQNKHNTVALSRKPGVMRGRTVLYPEFVDVFVFDSTVAHEAHEEETTQDLGAEGMSVSEQTSGEDTPVVEE